jgi:hypothetical protein
VRRFRFFGAAFAFVIATAAAPAVCQNLLTNPGFDFDLGGWDAQLDATYSTSDASGSATSGSALVVHDQGSPAQITQCVAVPPGAYRANVRYRVPSGQVTQGSGVFRVWAFHGSGCNGGYVDVQDIPLPASSFDTWLSATLLARVPPGAGSALFQLFFQRDQVSGPFEGYFDDARLVATDQSLLLGSFGRFQIQSDWATLNPPATGTGHGVMLTPRSGYFWFFGADNMELVIKVLDGCAVNNRQWVFLAGLTNVETEVRVTDRTTGVVRTYSNAQGHFFTTVLDTKAFPCP